MTNRPAKADASLLVALIIGVVVTLFIVQRQDVGPGPEPTPVNNDDAIVLEVIRAYATGCGESLVNNNCGESEADCNAELAAARKEARLQAHRAEDERLNEINGDGRKIAELGEAWLRLAKKLERVK